MENIKLECFKNVMLERKSYLKFSVSLDKRNYVFKFSPRHPVLDSRDCTNSPIVELPPRIK